MIKIHALKQPQEGRSGEELLPGKSIVISGFKIVNNNKFSVYVAKFTRKDPKKSPTAAGKKKKKVAADL